MIRNFWQKKKIGNYCLLPLSFLFYLIIKLRRFLYQIKVFKTTNFNIPVIVVGSIVAGGGGKTTTTIALANTFTDKGYTVGIVSRGYKRIAKQDLIVTKDTTVTHCGDEAKLMQESTSAKVAVANQRVNAVQLLLTKYPNINLIISDDGLQHYALDRDVEIVVLSPTYFLGNEYLIPAGPLREPTSRLAQVNFLVYKNNETKEFHIHLANPKFTNWQKEEINITEIKDKINVIVTAIAEPSEFINDIKKLNINISNTITYPDHYYFTDDDLSKIVADNIIMSRKDKIKCDDLVDNKRILTFSQEAKLDSKLIDSIEQKIKKP